jgi:hypothetical protein
MLDGLIAKIIEFLELLQSKKISIDLLRQSVICDREKK